MVEQNQQSFNQRNSRASASGSAQQSQSDIIQKKVVIERRLEESGEKARLEEYLKQRLVECGWKENLKKHCLGKCCKLSLNPRSHLTEIIKAKGLERINLEDLVEELLPKGRSLVPS